MIVMTREIRRRQRFKRTLASATSLDKVCTRTSCHFAEGAGQMVTVVGLYMDAPGCVEL